EAVDEVAASIKEFGFKGTSIVGEDNVIVAGETGKLAAQSIGIEEVPVIIADDLTEDQIKAFRLADNKVCDSSEWAVELLYSEMETPDIDMAFFGSDEELPDIDIDDVFEEEAEAPKVNKLKWGGGEIEINATDDQTLTDKLTDYKSHERRDEFTFVEYLLAGGDDAAIFS